VRSRRVTVNPIHDGGLDQTHAPRPRLGGHLYEIHVTTDESLSRAVYAQDDGKIFKVNKDAAGRFTVLGALLP